MSLPGPVQESDRSTTHHDARKTDLPRMGQRLFTDIRRSHKGTLVVDLKPDTPEWRRLCTNVFGGKGGGGEGGGGGGPGPFSLSTLRSRIPSRVGFERSSDIETLLWKIS